MQYINAEIMIAFSVSLSNPLEMKFFFHRISREKVHLFGIANVHRHHPPISSHSHLSHTVFVVTTHCDRLRLKQFSTGHGTWEKGHL